MMQRTIVIELPREPSLHPNWIVVSKDGVCDAAQNEGDPLLLQSLCEDAEVIVLVPADATVLQEVNLPPMNRERLKQALPFAIEESTPEEVGSLHVVAMPRASTKEGDSWTALSVKHTNMREWLSRLSTWKVVPTRMISMLQAVPYAEQSVSVWFDSVPVVRMSRDEALALDAENIAILPMFAQYSKVHVYKQENQTLPEAITALPLTHQEEHLLTRESRMELLAKTASLKTSINLLEDPYVVKVWRLPKGLGSRVLFGALIAWLVLLLLGPLVSYALLSSRVHDLNLQVAAIYQKHFPKEKNIRAPKERFAEKLNRYASLASETQLFLWLAASGKALAQVPNVDIQQLQYADGQMTLQVIANGAKPIESFVQALREHNLRVTQQNAKLTGEKASVSLLIQASLEEV